MVDRPELLADEGQRVAPCAHVLLRVSGFRVVRTRTSNLSPPVEGQGKLAHGGAPIEQAGHIGYNAGIRGQLR